METFRDTTLKQRFNEANKPSQLLSLSLEEVDKITKSRGYGKTINLNMSNWVMYHVDSDKPCSVCMGGAVLIGIVGNKHIRDLAIKEKLYPPAWLRDLELSKSEVDKLNLINNLRALNTIEEHDFRGKPLINKDQREKANKILDREWESLKSLNRLDYTRHWKDIKKSRAYYGELVKELQAVGC